MADEKIAVSTTQSAVTVYPYKDALRVVVGTHFTYDGPGNIYPNTKLAYAGETDNRIRSVILRIDPAANDDTAAEQAA